MRTGLADHGILGHFDTEELVPPCPRYAGQRLPRRLVGDASSLANGTQA